MTTARFAVGPWLGLFVLLIAASGCQQPASAQDGPIRIDVSNRVLIEDALRIGVNVAKSAYDNDKQFHSNPMAHGDFAIGQQVTLVEVGARIGSTVVDARFDSSALTRSYSISFAGGTYVHATGPHAGAVGDIAEHAPNSGRFRLEPRDAPLPEEGAFLWLYGPGGASRALPFQNETDTDLGIGNFRIEAAPDVSVTLVPADVPGDQWLEIAFAGERGRKWGRLAHPARLVAGGQYRVSLRARSNLRGAVLQGRAQFLGTRGTRGRIPMQPPRGVALTDSWQDVSLAFVAPDAPWAEADRTVLGIDAAVTLGKGETGSIWIDRVEFERIDADRGVFVDGVVEALRDLRPGVIRFYGYTELGTLVQSLIARSAVDAPWSYGSFQRRARFYGTQAVVDDWAALCLETGALPWITVGSANGPDDWDMLIGYLAGDADSDRYAGMRASHGRSEPWTAAFDRIYLEVGNEWWNRNYRPWHILRAEAYGELVDTVATAAQAHPAYDAAAFEIIAGGWANNVHNWNARLDASATAHDRISLAPYLLKRLDRYETPEDRYRSLFADVDAYQRNQASAIEGALAAHDSDSGLAVYEVNTHLSSPEFPARVSSEICPSFGAGLAVIDHAFTLMAEQQTQPVIFFNLLQRSFGTGANERVGLWGILRRENDGTLVRRPIAEAMRLANRAIEGDMVATSVSNSPTWDHAANGTVPDVARVPYVHAFAFVSGEAGAREARVIVVNRHLTQRQEVQLSMPFPVRSSYRRLAYASDNPAATNEDTIQVRVPESPQEATLGADQVVRVRPCSMTVLYLDEQSSGPIASAPAQES